MNLSASDPIDFVTDDMMPALASVADWGADHLADLPAPLAAVAGSKKAWAWSLRGLATVARRHPLVLGATVLAGGAAYVWRKRSNAPAKPIEFPKPAPKPANTSPAATTTDGLTAPTSA